MLKNLFLKLDDLLRYPTTYQSVVALLTAAGIHVAPELENLIITIGVSVFGAIGVFFSDVDVKPTAPASDASVPK